MAIDMLVRRQLLKAGLGGLGALAFSSPLAWALSARQANAWIFSAMTGEAGHHHVAGVSPDGRAHFLIDVPERCHGGCLRPETAQAVLFARRPGKRFFVVDGKTQRLVHRVEAGEGFHYYGHGVFDPQGRHLYVTANRIEDSAGLVRVYDAENGYAHLRDMPLTGIGPHELRLMPDGDTLVIALGGIQTHPDYDRIKLNLESMDPALVLMDRHSGRLLARHRPSHPQLSCRHLDVGGDGTVIAGYQFQGPEWERQPLVCRLDPQGRFTELSLPEELNASLNQYTASVAISRFANQALITAPRGNRVVILDIRHGNVIANFALPDAAGARCDGEGGFLVSSGQGGLYRVSSETPSPVRLANLALRWDNHLT